MTSLKDRIVQIRGGLERDEFGRLIGVSARTVQRWELEGGHPRSSELAKIAEVLGVDLNWLISGREEPSHRTELRPAVKKSDPNPACDWQPGLLKQQVLPPPRLPDWRPPSQEDFTAIPLIEQVLSQGGAAFVLSEPQGIHQTFRQQWLQKRTNDLHNLILLQIRGDSMEPTIRHNDTVMIDRGRVSVISGHIYAIGLESNIMVKRIFCLSQDRIRLGSDNLEYAPLNADLKDVHIIGEVIWFARELA